MEKIYAALGLMSGTSMDGVDASIIQSDGKSEYKAILDKYFEYPKNIYKNLTTLRDKIKTSKHLKKHQKQIKSIEKEITIFHAKAVNEILTKEQINIDFIGFHGQTIFHNAEEKITKQIGDGKLLSKLTKKTVVYDFRQNDLKNGGEGAPLTPIFHKMLAEKFNLAQKNISPSTQATFINIGGITNITRIDSYFNIYAIDCGPGMCLIDKWIRLNSANKIDKDGKIASKGNIKNQIVRDYIMKINRLLDNYRSSLDVSNFNLSLVKNLSFEDGAATLTELTAVNTLEWVERYVVEKTILILCGGGRKNKFLLERMKKYSNQYFKGRLKMIDEFGIDGDFVESQAFAYLAIRSFLKLPISFPETTGCKKPCTGGVFVKNF
ncbi:anhydro-N-acetylmuramic acid kinase [Candidatus Pelagibacter sp.]|nr:anhydro-N-acetylmuramic acid kinase [Candidatus Pelagibacter sp.]